MTSPKRIGFVLALISAISVTVICVSNFEQTSATASSVKVVTVLRRKDKKQDKPTGAEAASAQDVTEERKFEDKIPKHVPIKFKLKTDKEKKFKDLNNHDWYRDFELEVTNISDKPIYFLELWLEYVGIDAAPGVPLAVPLRYGRIEFVYHDTRPLQTDVPIQPGETFVFTIPESDQKGWEWHKNHENTPDPKKLLLRFVQLSYGDGSGFHTLQAVPYPREKKRAAKGPCREGPRLILAGGFLDIRFEQQETNRLRRETGAIAAGHFFAGKGMYGWLETSSSTADSCCGSGCYFMKENTESCSCGPSIGMIIQIVRIRSQNAAPRSKVDIGV